MTARERVLAAHQIDDNAERHAAIVAAGRGTGDALLEALARRSDAWLAAKTAAESNPFAVFAPPDVHLQEDVSTIGSAFAVSSGTGFQARFRNGIELLDSLESSFELARVLRDESNLELVRALSLAHAVTADTLDALVATDRFASLRELSFNGPLAGAIATIARAPWTKQITALTVAGDFLRPDGARAIASSFPRLQRLHAEGIDSMCLDPILAAPFVSNLETVWLGGNRITGVESKLDDSCAERIARASWKALRTMSLSGPNIGAPGVRALLESKTLPEGMKLSFLDVELSDDLRNALEARFDVLLSSRNT